MVNSAPGSKRARASNKAESAKNTAVLRGSAGASQTETFSETPHKEQNIPQPKTAKIKNVGADQYSVTGLKLAEINLIIACVRWVDGKIVAKDLLLENAASAERVSILRKLSDAIKLAANTKTMASSESKVVADWWSSRKVEKISMFPGVSVGSVSSNQQDPDEAFADQHEKTIETILNQSNSARAKPSLKKSKLTWARHRILGENPDQFIKRVYADRIGKLTRLDLKTLDRDLYDYLGDWLLKKKNNLSFDLPTREQSVSKELGTTDQSVDEIKERLKVVEREASALRRRLKKLQPT